VVSKIGSTPGEVEPEAAADIVDDEEKAFGLGEGVDGFDKFTCGQFLVPEGISRCGVRIMTAMPPRYSSITCFRPLQ
jgi:hypothetical protein